MSALVSVIFAPWITAPVESETKPSTAWLVDCAWAIGMVKRTADSNTAARITCNLEDIEKAPCVEKFSLQREDRTGEPALDGKRLTDSATLLRLGKLYSRRTSESSPNYCT